MRRLCRARRPRILYIHKNQNDGDLLRKAIHRTRSGFTLYTAEGTDSATKYFQYWRGSEPNPFPRPALILLDYNLGIHTGPDFLYWLRVMRKITAIPVIIYSNSYRPAQVSECYSAGANHYLRKTQPLPTLDNLVRTLRVCMCFLPQRFALLTRLPEYEPDSSRQPASE